MKAHMTEQVLLEASGAEGAAGGSAGLGLTDLSQRFAEIQVGPEEEGWGLVGEGWGWEVVGGRGVAGRRAGAGWGGASWQGGGGRANVEIRLEGGMRLGGSWERGWEKGCMLSGCS